MTTRTKLWLGISLGITVVSTLVFFLVFYQARLTITATPAGATIAINNQPVGNGATSQLVPGTYQIAVSAAGYLPTTQTVHLRISDIERRLVTLQAIPSVQTLTSDVRDPVLAADGQHLRYLGNHGSQFFEASTTPRADGTVTVTPLSHDGLTAITAVDWSPDPALVVYQTSDGRTKLFDFTRYDFLHQEEQDLGPDLRGLTWHPTDRALIGYLVTAAGERSLVRKTLGSDTLERLADVRSYQFANPTLSWSPNGRAVAIVENGIYLLDVNTRVLTKVAGSDGARTAIWSPNSQELLAQFDTSLAVLAAHGQSQMKRLDVRSSLDKAVWAHDSQTVIVATPTDQGRDSFYAIDSQSGQKVAFAYQATGAVSATNLVVNATGTDLWFVSNGTLDHLHVASDPGTTGGGTRGN